MQKEIKSNEQLKTLLFLQLELQELEKVYSVFSDFLFIIAKYIFLFETTSPEPSSIKPTHTKFETLCSTQDPARDGGNWYAYCGNNPLVFTDRNGLWFGADDVFTGPIDEILVFGGITIFTAVKIYNSDANKNFSEALSDVFTENINKFKEHFSKNKNDSKAKTKNDASMGASAGAPSPDPDDNNHGKKIGENGTKTNSRTTWKNGKTERLDVENPAPGERDGQIHYHDANNNKYMYDIENKNFYNPDTNELAPKNIQNLLQNKKFMKGIEKGLETLGETK